jgi:hypothetical protein
MVQFTVTHAHAHPPFVSDDLCEPDEIPIGQNVEWFPAFHGRKGHD